LCREEAEIRITNSAVLILEDSIPVKSILNSTIRNHLTTYITICSSHNTAHEKLADYWKHLIIASFALVLNDAGTYDLFAFEPENGGIIVQKREQIRQVSIEICRI